MKNLHIAKLNALEADKESLVMCEENSVADSESIPRFCKLSSIDLHLYYVQFQSIPSTPVDNVLDIV